jgi:geranylgeranyl diphosphate synthase type II
MDAAPLRRGKPTVHQKFGLNAGILSGDAMLVKAYEFLLETESNHLVDILKIFTKMAVEVCEGQQMDMNFETQADVSIEDYLKMIELKTAVLVGSAVQLGALIGGGSIEDANLLYDFGRSLGIAFQLQDDLLDAFGDPKKFGKKPGGDIIQKKKTYLYLKTLEVAPKETATRFKEFYNSEIGDEAIKINQVLHSFEEFGVRSLTEKKKEDYWQQSLNSLRSVNVPEFRKTLLKEFANALMSREF